MRKVYLRMNEQYKYDVISKLVDTHGNKKNAAIKLNCSVRAIDRLIIRYKAEGKAGFIHKSRNRQPASTIPVDIKNKVIDLYRTNILWMLLLIFGLVPPSLISIWPLMMPQERYLVLILIHRNRLMPIIKSHIKS